MTVINDSVKVEKIITRDENLEYSDSKLTSIYICVGSEKILLCEKITDDYRSLNYVFDENYIVAIYNFMDSFVEAVYDINNKKILELDDEKRRILEYMYISDRRFNIEIILQYINEADLKITSEEKITEFEKYITGFNKNISKEEVIDYICEEYPIFEDYKDISAPLSVIDYRKIVEEIRDIINNSYVKLSIIRHIVD